MYQSGSAWRERRRNGVQGRKNNPIGGRPFSDLAPGPRNLSGGQASGFAQGKASHVLFHRIQDDHLTSNKRAMVGVFFFLIHRELLDSSVQRNMSWRNNDDGFVRPSPQLKSPLNRASTSVIVHAPGRASRLPTRHNTSPYHPG